jgi:hypothetical protein
MRLAMSWMIFIYVGFAIVLAWLVASKVAPVLSGLAVHLIGY